MLVFFPAAASTGYTSTGKGRNSAMHVAPAQNTSGVAEQQATQAATQHGTAPFLTDSMPESPTRLVPLHQANCPSAGQGGSFWRYCTAACGALTRTLSGLAEQRPMQTAMQQECYYH